MWIRTYFGVPDLVCKINARSNTNTTVTESAAATVVVISITIHVVATMNLIPVIIFCCTSGLHMDRLEHHNINYLKKKRSGERKWPTFNPPRLGMICVQPDKHWHCF